MDLLERLLNRRQTELNNAKADLFKLQVKIEMLEDVVSDLIDIKKDREKPICAAATTKSMLRQP